MTHDPSVRMTRSEPPPVPDPPTPSRSSKSSRSRTASLQRRFAFWNGSTDVPIDRAFCGGERQIAAGDGGQTSRSQLRGRPGTRSGAPCPARTRRLCGPSGCLRRGRPGPHGRGEPQGRRGPAPGDRPGGPLDPEMEGRAPRIGHRRAPRRACRHAWALTVIPCRTNPREVPSARKPRNPPGPNVRPATP